MKRFTAVKPATAKDISKAVLPASGAETSGSGGGLANVLLTTITMATVTRAIDNFEVFMVYWLLLNG